MVACTFEQISEVPTGDAIVEALQMYRESPIAHEQSTTTEIRSYYTGKVAQVQDACEQILVAIHDDSPRLESVHPFYAALLAVHCDGDHFSHALSRLRDAICEVICIGADHVSLLKLEDSPDCCHELARTAAEEICAVVKELGPVLAYLEQVRQHLVQMPDVNPMARTLLLCGCPNVGKSTLMSQITEADGRVSLDTPANSIWVGCCEHKGLPWQVIDTPGLLDRRPEERSAAEKQAICALTHLDAVVLFVLDCSSGCPCSIEQQVSVCSRLRPVLGDKPVVLVLSKADVQPFAACTSAEQAQIGSLQAELVSCSATDPSAVERVKAAGAALLARCPSFAGRRARSRAAKEKEEGGADEAVQEQEQEGEGAQESCGRRGLLALPWALIGRCWPGERVVAGRRACAALRQSLATHAGDVVLVRRRGAGCGEERLRSDLQRLRRGGARVSLAWVDDEEEEGQRGCKVPGVVRAAGVAGVGGVLRRLVLRGERVGASAGEVAEVLRGSGALESFDLSKGDVDARGMGALAGAIGGCARLEWVAMGENPLGEEGVGRLVEGLQACKRLRHLDLRETDMENEGMARLLEGLGAWEQLACLDVRFNAVEVEHVPGLERLAACRGLERLHLGGNVMREDGESCARFAGVLRRCERLREVELGNCFIRGVGGGEVAAALGALPNLCDLDLHDNDINGASLRRILRESPRLARVNLSRNYHPDPEVAQLGAALREVRCLTQVELLGLGFGEAGLKALAEGLAGCRGLTALRLGDNACSSFHEGATARLGEALGALRGSLRTLELGRWQMGAAQLASLAPGLGECVALTDLDLRHNIFGDEGAACLAEAVRGCTALERLDVVGNSIGDEGAARLGEALGGSALVWWNLRENLVSEAAARGLRRALPRCTVTLRPEDAPRRDLPASWA